MFKGLIVSVLLIIKYKQQLIELKLQNKRTFFTAEIEIGSEHQKFRVLIDTGSNYLWVKSNKCDQDENKYVCGHLGLLEGFKCKESTTCIQRNNKQIEQQYGVGKISGILTHESIRLNKNMSVQNMILIEVQQSKDLGQDQVEGLMGLGYNRQKNELNIVEKLKLEGKIQRGCSICGYESRLGIGGIGEDGDMVYGRVESENRWIVELDGIQVGGRRVEKGKVRALVDSGTSELSLSSFIMDEIIKLFTLHSIICHLQQNQQHISFLQCNSLSSYPPLTFFLQNTPFTLHSNQYIRQCTFTTQFTCNLHLILNNLHSNSFDLILGTPFIQQFYTIFDLDHHRIGFKHKKSTTSSSFLFHPLYILNHFTKTLSLLYLEIIISILFFIIGIQQSFKNINNTSQTSFQIINNNLNEDDNQISNSIELQQI